MRPRRRLLAAGLGAALALVGCATVPSIDHRQLAMLEKGQSPDQVVAGMQALSDAGIDGVTLSWVDYAEGLDQMERLILPRMRAAGLRA